MPYRPGPLFALALVVGVGLFVANNTVSLAPREGSQLSAGGVLSILWEDLPESDNVEDRRPPDLGNDAGVNNEYWYQFGGDQPIQSGTIYDDEPDPASEVDAAGQIKEVEYLQTLRDSENYNWDYPDPASEIDPAGQLKELEYLQSSEGWPTTDDGEEGGGRYSGDSLEWHELPPGTVIFRNEDGTLPEGPFTIGAPEPLRDEYGNLVDPRGVPIDEWGVPIDIADYETDMWGNPISYARAYEVDKPWYVEAFPGFGAFFQNIIPGASHAVMVAAPASPPVYAPSPRPQYAQPSCWISANPVEVAYNGTATLQWNAFNSTRAALTGFGEVSVGGSRTVPSITTDRTYTLDVFGPGGSNTCYTRIAVRPPARPASCIIAVNPDVIARGGVANLAWGSESAERATLSGVGSVNIRGGIYVKPSQTTAYTLTVYNSENRPNSCVARIVVR